MGFLKYLPSPVLIPSNSKLQREFKTRESTVDNVPLTDREYQEYDSRTIFYDVFCDAQSHKIFAIGPPPINLQAEILSLKIMREDNFLHYTRKQYAGLCIIEILFNEEVDLESELSLRFCFQSFDVMVRVSPSPLGRAITKPRISLLTLQKDNPIPWITDWCLWHQRLHGVSHIVLYDNGSDDSDELEIVLRRMSKDIDITFVAWHFPFGPGRSDKNRYCKTGAHNHYRLLFSASDAWCLWLDVDEYLVVNGERTLAQHLNNYDREAVSEIMIDSFIVPPYRGQPEMDGRRASLHTFCSSTPRGYALKYIYKPAAMEYSRTHIAYPKNRLFKVLLVFPRIYNRVLRLLYGSILKRLAKSNALRWFYPRRVSFRYPSTEKMFFYHFRGLNTNWRPEVNLGEQEESFNPEHHVTDLGIQKLAKQAGLCNDG